MIFNRQQLHIHNIYIPPRSICTAGRNASIAHLLSNSEMSLIVGVLMLHHYRWDTETNEDERVEQLVKIIDADDYTILSEHEATWLLTNGRSTSSDISLASSFITLLSHWSISASLANNHLSILIAINSKVSTIDESWGTYISYKKVDWARYAEA